MPDTSKTPSRRGRPTAADRELKRERVLDAATHELLAHGYEHVTMLAIARRARASKETLYSWFGNKEGLYRSVIERNADASAAQIKAAFDTDDNPRSVLTGYAIGLLSLLTSDGSIAINRASMSSPTLASLLLESGRFRIGPIVEAYLERLDSEGTIKAPDPAASFQLLYGLVMRDIQIRVLLGEPPPTKKAIAKAASEAVDHFWRLST